MNTLEYLNTLSSQTLSFTDNRPAGIVFDRPAPKNLSFTSTDVTFSALVGINIAEIIQPQTTNVRYTITLIGLNATANFGTLPTGCNLVGSGPTYTITGIDSVNDWEAVKSPLITIGEDEFGNFSYESKIVYDTDTTYNNEVVWTVGQYIPQGLFESISTLTAQGNYLAVSDAILQSYATMTVYGIEALFVYADIDVSANMISRSNTATLPVVASMDPKPTLLAFTQVTSYSNPQAGVENTNNQEFGEFLAGYKTRYVTTRKNTGADDNVLYVYDNGVLIDELAGNPNVITHRAVAISENYIAFAQAQETAGTDDVLVFKKQLDGTYASFDSVAMSGPLVDLQLNDTHLSISRDDRHTIFSINELTEQLDYDGVIAGGTSKPAVATGMNSTLFVIANDNTDPNSNDVEVYNLSDLSFNKRINLTNPISDISVLNNELSIAFTSASPRIYNLSSGALVYTLTQFTSSEQCQISGEYYTFKSGVNLHIVNKTNGSTASTITRQQLDETEGEPESKYYVWLNDDTNFLVIGEPSYDDNSVVDQGRLYVLRDY